MKKNTVLRNESPHAVKMQAGSNVAERKTSKTATAKEPEDNAKVDAPAIRPPLPVCSKAVNVLFRDIGTARLGLPTKSCFFISNSMPMWWC